MNLLNILLILTIVLWVYSVFAFAEWRFRAALQKGVSFPNALKDKAKMLYLKGTALIILMLIFHIMS